MLTHCNDLSLSTQRLCSYSNPFPPIKITRMYWSWKLYCKWSFLFALIYDKRSSARKKSIKKAVCVVCCNRARRSRHLLDFFIFWDSSAYKSSGALLDATVNKSFDRERSKPVRGLAIMQTCLFVCRTIALTSTTVINGSPYSHLIGIALNFLRWGLPKHINLNYKECEKNSHLPWCHVKNRILCHVHRSLFPAYIILSCAIINRTSHAVQLTLLRAPEMKIRIASTPFAIQLGS